MPVRPQLSWEQTHDEVLLQVTLQGCKRDAVDVFVSDTFVKVNAAPTYLLTLDLLHAIDAVASSHYFAATTTTTTAVASSTSGSQRDGDKATATAADAHARTTGAVQTSPAAAPLLLLLHVKLRKREGGVVWPALCIEHTALSKAARLARRAAAADAVQADYNARLQQRAQQRDAERRRMTNEQWELEKAQRRVIEQRVAAEKAEAQAELYAWQDATTTTTAAATSNGNNDDEACAASSPAPSSVPAVRQSDTVCVRIDFTPQTHALPTRARGDEEYYRKSRYKPVSIEDSPMFWKERADAHYRAGAWADAARAYSESIKRDGVFLTCVANRAACHLQRAAWSAAAADCTLALTMLANTPASDVTQSRYRYLMAKLHARRGAALCWSGDCARGLDDLRVAAAYTDADGDAAAGVAADVRLIESLLQQQQEEQQQDDEGNDDDNNNTTATTRNSDDKQKQRQQQREEAATMTRAAALYHQGSYDEAVSLYTTLLARNARHAHAHANVAAALLHLGRFRDAMAHCTWLIDYCAEAAEALTLARGSSACSRNNDKDNNDDSNNDNTDSNDDDDDVTDSDDEDGDDGAADAQRRRRQRRRAREQRRRQASQLLSERSGHVYLLLKAYVRGAAALCGMHDYRQAHTLLERALRITPYDNDLLDDCNRLAEKIRMDTLVAASTQPQQPQQQQCVQAS